MLCRLMHNHWPVTLFIFLSIWLPSLTEAVAGTPLNENQKATKISPSYSKQGAEIFDQVDSLMQSKEFQNLIKDQKQALLNSENLPTPQSSNREREIEMSQIKPDQSSQNQQSNQNNVTVLSRLSPPTVLISFSMPDADIKHLLLEANRYDSPLVIRGLHHNNFKATLEKIKEYSLYIKSSQGISIDPTLFSRFDVRSVPTFILPLETLSRCDSNHCPTPKHVKASGSVSIAYFLELVSRTGTKSQRAIAHHWIEKGKIK